MQHGKYYKNITSETNALQINFSELWQYRDLIALLVKRDFISKYKQTVLGPAWAIIQPLLTTIVFTFIFGNVAGLADCGKVPTFLFYMCGNIAWNFFANSLSGTAGTFINNRGTMGKVYFPRLAVPISTVLSQLIGFGIQMCMLVVAIVVYIFIPDYEIVITPFIILLPVLVFQMSMLSLGCGVIISACTTKYRDLQFLVSFGVSLWMYGTPVAYSLSIFKSNRILFTLARINPMTSIIETMRLGLLGHDAAVFDGGSYLMSWIITMILFLIGVVYFNKVEKTFMDTV